jgi:hypothetical protein
MRGKKMVLVVLLLAAVGLNGCGTVCNLAGREPEIYGGLGKDFEFASTPRFNGADKGVEVS